MVQINGDDSGPISKFPADDLSHAKRFITTHNERGQGVFHSEDHGEHHRVMVRGKGVANIVYSTQGSKVDLNNERDIAWARENEPGIHVHDGSVVRLIDFAPGVESPLHRALSIDYGIVIEGEFELTLDSGESRIMRPGDISINRGCMHKWRNCLPDKSGRMVFILLDVAPLKIAGKLVEQDLGTLASEYAGRE